MFFLPDTETLKRGSVKKLYSIVAAFIFLFVAANIAQGQNIDIQQIKVFSPTGSAPVATGSGVLNLAGGIVTWQPASGGGTPCTTTNFSLQANVAGSFGCVPDVLWSSPHTLTFGAASITVFAAGATVTGITNAMLPNPLTANTSGTAANLTSGVLLPAGTTAATQSVGNNTQLLATTAFVLANVGSGNPCSSTALALQFNNGGLFGCVSDVTYNTHTVTFGASGILDLSATAPTAGFKLPAATGAVPVLDAQLAFNTTNHSLVFGSNSNTLAAAAAASGTNFSTTCSNQVFTVISAIAIPTCTSLTNAYLPFTQVNTANITTAGMNNFLTSTTNTVGLTITPSNPGTNQVKFEITGGAYTGTASNLSGTPTVPNGTAATTQSTADNTTKLATDAFVNAEIINNGVTTSGSPASADCGYFTGSKIITGTVNCTMDSSGDITAAGAINGGTLSAGTAPTSAGPTAAGGFAATESTSTGWTPTTGQDYIRADSTAHTFLCSYNGAAETTCGGASLAFPETVSGTTTSGGIPYFSSTTVLTSSALLALKHVVLGGGAGGAPTSDSALDDGATTANTLTYTGTAGIAAPALTTNGSGAGLVALTAGAEGCVAGQPASSVCLEAPATVGTAYHMLLPAAVGTSSQALTIASVTGQAVTLGFATVTGGSVFPVTVSGTVTSGGIPYFSSTTAETSSAILNTNILVKGGGAGGAPTNSSITDNGTTVSTAEAVTALSVAVGTSPPTCTIGTGGASCFNEGTAATGASAVDNIYANSTAHCLDVNYNNVEKGCLLGQPAGLVTIQTVTGADYTNATVTPSTVFSWTLPATAAAQNYKYTCDIMWESTAATLVGPVFGLNISAAPTQLTGAASVQNALAGADINGYLSNTTTGSQTLVTSTAAGVTSTNYWAKIWGTIEGSPTAGATFIINAASTSGTTASLNIRRGSSCKLEVIE